MTREAKELFGEIADAFDLDLEFSHGGKHPVAIFRRNGAERKVFFSGSPSCKRSARNMRSDALRVIREAGWAQ